MARTVGDWRQEASAHITLGSALTYLDESDAGLAALADGLADRDRAPAITETALRATLNISDALELLGRHEEAAETAARGLAEARRVGLPRRYGVLLTYNLVEPLVRLGRWAEADRIAAEAAELDPLGTRSGALYDLRGAIAVGSGRFDDAARYVELVRSLDKELEVQEDAWITMLEAEVQHARGDLAGARADGRAPARRRRRVGLRRAVRLAAGLARDARRGRHGDAGTRPARAAARRPPAPTSWCATPPI